MLHTMKDIEDLSMHDPIVHACRKLAEHHNLSSEQMLLEMVWHLRQSNQRIQTQLTNVLMNSPRVYSGDIIGRPSPFKVATNADLAKEGDG